MKLTHADLVELQSLVRVYFCRAYIGERSPGAYAGDTGQLREWCRRRGFALRAYGVRTAGKPLPETVHVTEGKWIGATFDEVIVFCGDKGPSFSVLVRFSVNHPVPPIGPLTVDDVERVT